MKKKYFVTGDIHGFYSEFRKALDDAGFDPNNENHVLLICGDLFDRGPEAKELLSYLCSFPEGRLLLVRGNHEDLMEEMVYRRYPESYDFSNKTVDTLRQFLNDIYPGITENGASFHIKEGYQKMLKEGLYDLQNLMKNYIEIGDYIFVHGWIPVKDVIVDDGNMYYEKYEYNPDWRHASPERWDSGRWLNGMEMYHLGIREKGKTIVCGHWHASYGNVRKMYPGRSAREYSHLEFASGKEAFLPFEEDGIIALDACTSFTKMVNIVTLEIDDGK